MISIGILLLLTIKYSCSMKDYFKILEEAPIGTELVEVSKFLRARIRPEYKFTIIGEPNFADCISIHEKSGTTKIKKRIDRETLCTEIQDQLNAKCTKSLRLILSSMNRKDDLDLEFEIMDINDNKPSWPNNVINFPYPESTEKQPIKLAIAIDKDTGDNAVIRYCLQSTNLENNNFNLENKENRLVLTPKFDIDFEIKKHFNVTIVAEDRGTPSLSSILNVRISVMDVNDNRPLFIQKLFHPHETVYETTLIEAVILKVIAYDKDSEENGRITYHIDSSMPQFVKDQFYLDGDTGELKLKKTLDFDRHHKLYRFIVIAKDSAPAPYELSSSATVEIQVTDVNDEIPQIYTYFTTPHVSSSSNTTININISENLPPQQFDLAHIQVEDFDEDDKSYVDCSLDNTKAFQLIPDSQKTKTFILAATKSFDREVQQTESVRITCRDLGKNENYKVIIINITDKNDNTPKFTQQFNFHMNENKEYKRQEIGQITAVDKDQGINAELRYKIIMVQPRSEIKFRLNQITGKMYVDEALDREEQDHYNLTVTATDQGEPSLTGTGSILIIIDDVNDWSPGFDYVEYKFKIFEDAPINSKVGSVHATDRDIGKNAKIIYQFYSDNLPLHHQRSNTIEKFYIKKETGEITIINRLDRETTSSYQLVVLAANVGNHNMFTTTATVHVIVLDCNDNRPIFEKPSNFSVQYINSDLLIGSEITRFIAKDADELKNGNIEYTIVPAAEKEFFTLDLSTGQFFLAKKIEHHKSYKLLIKACDTGVPPKCSENLVFSITVTKPTFHETDHNVEYTGHKPLTTDSNGTIIACLIVIFIILVMAVVVMFFLIRNKNLIWKRRMDNNYDKSSVSEIQMRNPDSTFSKKEAGSIYEGDLLLLNERHKANNMMHNSMYSPKIYVESQISGRAESPCYRTIDAMNSSVYNPISHVPGDPNMSNLNCHPQTCGRYSQHQHYRGASEPLYRYSNWNGRNAFTPTVPIHPSYYQSIAPSGSATIRLNKKSNENSDRFNSKLENSNILVNYDARSMPRSVSLMKFYEKQNELIDFVNEKNPNYEAVNRAKYVYEALREGSFI